MKIWGVSSFSARVLLLFSAVFTVSACRAESPPPPPREDRVDGSWPVDAPRSQLMGEIAAAEANDDFVRKAQLNLLLGDQSRVSGNSVQAEVEFRGALAIFQQQKMELESAAVAIQCAVMARDRGDFARARKDLESAIAVLEQPRHRRISSSLMSPSKAIIFSLFEKSGLEIPKDEESPEARRIVSALAQSMLGEIAFSLGEYEEADTRLKQMLDESPENLPGALRAGAAQLLARSARKQGRTVDSRRYFSESLAQLGGEGCVGVTGEALRRCVLVLNDLGDLEHGAGNGGAALHWNERALDAARRFGEPFAQLEVLSSRCLMLPRFGSIEGKKELLAEAERLVARVVDPRSKQRGLVQIAVLANCSGEPEKLLAAAFAAESLLRDFPNPEVHVAVQGLIEVAKPQLGIDSDASADVRPAQVEVSTRRAREFNRAVESLKAISSNPQGASQALDTLLQVQGIPAQERADVARAFDDLRKARTGTDALQNYTRLLSALENIDILDAPGSQEIEVLAETLVHGQAPEVARIMIQQMREPSPSTHLPEWQVAEELLARTLLEMPDRDSAMSLAHDWVRSFDTAAASGRVAAFDLLRSGRAEKAHETLLRLTLEAGGSSSQEESFSIAERARSFSLMRWLGRAQPNPRERADPHLLDLLNKEKKAIRELEEREPPYVAELNELSDSLRKSRRRYDEVLLRLKLTQPGYAELAAAVTMDVEHVQRLLPSQTSLVSYFTLPDKTLAWVVEPDRWAMVELAISRAELAKRVMEFRASIAQAGAQPNEPRTRGVIVEDGLGMAPAKELGGKLFRDLVLPLQRHIRHRNVLVVPHDSLHQLPFAALFDDQKKLYLGQQYALAFLPSASALSAWSAPSPPDGSRPLILGDPETKVGALPNARQEAIEIASKFGTAALVGVSATESSVRNAASSLTLLHIAAHGIPDGKEPRESYLALAKDPAEDGRLKMGEIFDELRLPRRPLVVLSACQSGLGRQSGGDEVEGMIRAFLFAGAGAVMATQWDIADEASKLLIQDFYQSLIAGRSAAEALQDAQASLISHPRYSEPFFWAGFSLTGDPRRAPR